MEPTSLQEAIVYFADPANCREYLVARRWPDGVMCPKCGSKNVLFMEKYNRWHCREKHDAPQFTLKTGTVMEDSPISLSKWLPAMWLLVNCRNGISSYEIARDLKVTQKTAWFMLHRIRLAMKDAECPKLGGPDSNGIEVDESFIGGESKNMHKWKRKAKGITGSGSKQGKVIVQGILERGGRVKVEIVPNRSKKILQAPIKEHVAKGSEVFTDELRSYTGLNKEYIHEVINHAEEYVRGKVHTNGMENFWSLLKRGLGGTYVSVEPFHLDRYLDEQVFRFNNRIKKNDADRFNKVLSQIPGRRLTYESLTALVASSEPF